MVNLLIRCKRTLDGDYPMPAYGRPGDSGLDLAIVRWRYSWHGKDAWRTDPVRFEPRERLVVDTGWAFEIPHSFEGQVRSRSGLARDVGILAAHGTVDSNYRGSVQVTLFHHGDEEKRFVVGDRIAQIVFAPVGCAALSVVTELSETSRGSAGHGSSGIGPSLLIAK